MTTYCLECGMKIDSYLIVEGIKTWLHLRNEHPDLVDRKPDAMCTENVVLENGKKIHLLGDFDVYEEEGQRIIQKIEQS